MVHRVKRFVKKNWEVVNTFLSLLMAMVSGVYISLLCSTMQEEGGLLRGVQQLGWSNLYVGVFFALLYAQRRIPRLVGEKISIAAIQAMLEATARALLHPLSDTDIPLRAFYHRYESSTRELVPECHWMHHHSHDRDARIPVDNDAFVISRAFKEKRVVASNVGSAQTDGYPAKLKERIWDQIGSILAAPVRDFDDPHSGVLGTVAFDSCNSCADMKFDTDEARDIAASIATAIYRLYRNE